MVENPMEGTEPRVQRLFHGCISERVCRPQGPAGAGFSAYPRRHYPPISPDMLYVILAVIAVGVLLASEPGKKLLQGSAYLVGALAMLVLWFVVFSMIFGSDDPSSHQQGYFLGVVLFVICTIAYFRRKTKEEREHLTFRLDDQLDEN